jgi:GTPase SAR1 family protein
MNIQNIKGNQLDHDHFFKITIIGDDNVGKTNFISRFVDNAFIEEHVPTVILIFYFCF